MFWEPFMYVRYVLTNPFTQGSGRSSNILVPAGTFHDICNVPRSTCNEIFNGVLFKCLVGN